MDPQKPKQYKTARKKYHVIYKTTCSVTNKYYIGMHSTDNLEDGYIGSGKRLWMSIRKHGTENHNCVIIEHLPTRESLRLRESELIDKKLIKDSLCMNLALGGDGSWDHVNSNRTPEQWEALHKAGHTAMMSTLTFEQKSAKSKAVWMNHRDKILASQKNQNGLIAMNSDEAKRKRKDTMKLNGHCTGNKNPMHEKKWMHKDGKSKPIHILEIDTYQLQGWILGRKISSLQRVEILR